jgi:hypothetical protein
MLELSGNAELLVVDLITQEEERLALTEKDFEQERRSLVDKDILGEDEEGLFVAYASALGYDFRVVATPPNRVAIEDNPEEIRVEILEHNFEFVEPSEDDDEIPDL